MKMALAVSLNELWVPALGHTILGEFSRILKEQELLADSTRETTPKRSCLRALMVCQGQVSITRTIEPSPEIRLSLSSEQGIETRIPSMILLTKYIQGLDNTKEENSQVLKEECKQ